MKNYDAEYFIKFFSKIPKNEWTTGIYHQDGKSCAVGHCMDADARGKMPLALFEVLNCNPTTINDNGSGLYTKLGKHPKTRIINALKKIVSKSK